MSTQTPLQRAVFMACLILAGEVIFTLPFHVTRFFRPTVLAAFDLTNTELGQAQAAYGVTAMIAYVPGGPLADRFQARSLLTLSLAFTAVGGLAFATLPSARGMAVLFGYWGFSTIALFWAAMIRATRDWGGADEQGRAFGILDGGRGLVAAMMASAAALLLASLFPTDATSVDDAQRRTALRAVILAYTFVTMAAAGLVWRFVPGTAIVRPSTERAPLSLVFAALGEVARRPAVWLNALIVLSAYVAYKGFDNVGLFAHEVYGMSEADAGVFTSTMQWMRPVAAIGAGLVADRVGGANVVIACFTVLLGVDLAFALSLEAGPHWFLVANVAATCAAMFGLRGIYFALFEEAAVPAAVTGTAVGLVSLIGYTPDVFVSLVAGILLDASPGVTGHQHFYAFLSAFAGLGLVSAVAFRWFTRRGRRD